MFMHGCCPCKNARGGGLLLKGNHLRLSGARPTHSLAGSYYFQLPHFTTAMEVSWAHQLVRTLLHEI